MPALRIERTSGRDGASDGRRALPINETANSYSKVVDTYEAARPDYPAGIFSALPLADVRAAVELGAGTGKFTRLLRSHLPEPAELIAVEPVAAMAAKLEKLPAVRVCNRSAADTGLAAGCADLVVCAQAFHWFDDDTSVAEIARILRPGGTLALIWNIRDTRIGWVRALDAAVDAYQGDTPREKTGRWRWVLADPRFTFDGETVVANPWPMSRRGVQDRVLSTSFVAKLPQADRRKLAADVDAILDAHGLGRATADGGQADGAAITLPYVTHLYRLTRTAT